MIKRVADKVWKLGKTSNIYFLDLDKKIIIDTGNRNERNEVLMILKPLIEPEKIDIVIFTHLHYDHIGNYDLFQKAAFYASKEEIESYKKDPAACMLNRDYNKNFDKITLNELPEEFAGLKIVHTPGHTKGSICVWYAEKKILFSGDTLFEKRKFGRTDLPTSAPQELVKTMITLSRYPYDILCPGHDYFLEKKGT